MTRTNILDRVNALFSDRFLIFGLVGIVGAVVMYWGHLEELQFDVMGPIKFFIAITFWRIGALIKLQRRTHQLATVEQAALRDLVDNVIIAALVIAFMM